MVQTTFNMRVSVTNCFLCSFISRMLVSGCKRRNKSVTTSWEVLDVRSGTAEGKQCVPCMRREHNMHIAFHNELFMFGGHNGTNNYQYQGIWNKFVFYDTLFPDCKWQDARLKL